MKEKYRQIRLLGRGATAHVWLAEGPDGLVALKVAHQPGSLRREVALLRRLRHPAIAMLVDADPEGDWLAMEHASRGASTEWAPGQPLSTLVEFSARLAEGVGTLHAEGVIHGDLKPGNVLVGDDNMPRLVDLGSATDGPPAGETGATAGYAAPERLRSSAPTVATDLWGLGAIIHTLLTRRPPFVSPGKGDVALDNNALVWAPLTTLPEPPSSVRPRMPAALDELVLQLMAHRPSARPTSARAVAGDLRATLGTPNRAPIVGMARERDQLRRALVETIGGGRSMIVLHGPAGSGRRALIRETVQAARREGVRIVPAGDQDAIAADLASGEPCVLALDGGAPGSEDLLLRLLVNPASALVLVRSDRPLLSLARRGARHLHPCPLTLDDITLLIENLGHDRHRAEAVLRRSSGMPGAVQGILAPVSLQTLTTVAQKVMQHLRTGALTVPVLARRMELPEHQVLDIVEPMIDRGLVAASADGVWLSVPR